MFSSEWLRYSLLLEAVLDSCGSAYIPEAAAAAAAVTAAVAAAKQRLVQRVNAVDFAVEVRLERVEALGDRKAL